MLQTYIHKYWGHLSFILLYLKTEACDKIFIQNNWHFWKKLRFSKKFASATQMAVVRFVWEFPTKRWSFNSRWSRHIVTHYLSHCLPVNRSWVPNSANEIWIVIKIQVGRLLITLTIFILFNYWDVSNKNRHPLSFSQILCIECVDGNYFLCVGTYFNNFQT